MKGSLAAAASAGIASSLTAAARANVRGANDDIRVAIVGIRSKGKEHIDDFRKIDGVRVVALCDVDKDILAERAQKFTERNEKISTYTDVRRVLDDKDIDAVVIATPNHWHSLMTIWACQAGKDVYVEKPISHNIWEGRKVVEAAGKYNRIVQTGTQNRSDVGLVPAMEYIHGGNLGKMLYVHGICYRRRKSIGKVDGPQPIPEAVDYDLWTGPAPLGPLMRKSLHYDWHWVWATGNGDICNQGVHEMDVCLWALGKTELAPRVISLGGRFGYDDDGETSNTMVSFLDYKPVPIIFEVRGLPKDKNAGEAMDHCLGIRVGNIIRCEDGYFAGGRGGGWIYDNDDNKIKQFPGDGGGEHQANFIEAVRSRKVSDLRAPILGGHLSAALCHMANISYRLGQKSTPERVREAVNEIPLEYAQKRWKSVQEHLFLNWIDLAQTRATVGPWLDMDPDTERFVDDDTYSVSRWANDLATRNYRKPFVVPEVV